MKNVQRKLLKIQIISTHIYIYIWNTVATKEEVKKIVPRANQRVLIFLSRSNIKVLFTFIKRQPPFHRCTSARYWITPNELLLKHRPVARQRKNEPRRNVQVRHGTLRRMSTQKFKSVEIRRKRLDRDWWRARWKRKGRKINRRYRKTRFVDNWSGIKIIIIWKLYENHYTIL